MTSLGILLAFLTLCATDTLGYVRYERCHEYKYSLQAKTSFKDGTAIVVKARFSVEILNNKNRTEALLRIFQAREEYGSHGESILEHNRFGNWFSAIILPDGEVRTVIYPRRENFHVLMFKKTIINYLSSKFNNPGEASQYETTEWNTGGKHRGRYHRVTNSFDVVFTKTEHHPNHPAAPYAEVASQKKVFISHEARVPRRVEMQQHMRAFHKVQKTATPRFDPRANVTVDETTRKAKVPDMRMFGHGQLVLLDNYRTPCNISRPSGLKEDSLEIRMTGQEEQQFDKVEFAKNQEEIFAQLDSNITQLHDTVSQGKPRSSTIFNRIVDILSAVPDEHIMDVMFYYFKNSSITSIHEDRRVILDAMLSLRSPAALEAVHHFVLSPEAPRDDELIERSLHLIGAFDLAPPPNIVLAIKRMAFPRAPFLPERLHHTAKLIYGIVVRLLFASKDKLLRLRAHAMLGLLEKHVGVHDPYHWRVRRSLSEEEEELRRDRQAILIEALGNAGQMRSIGLLASHVNNSDAPLALRQAALHAVRNFHNDIGAGILLEASLFDSEDHMRRMAVDLYYQHPLAQDLMAIYAQLSEGFRNGSYPRCPMPLTEEQEAALPHHHRIVRRSIMKLLSFRLKYQLRLPYYYWVRKYGNDKLGSSMGFKAENEVDIDIALTKGHVQITVDNFAYFLVHVGLLGYDFHVLDAKACFIGRLEYSFDIFQALGLQGIQRLAKLWDQFHNGVAKRIRNAVMVFRRFIDGALNFENVVKGVVQLVEDFPQKVKNFLQLAKKAAAKLGMFDPPPFMKPLFKVFRRIIQLIVDIKADISDAYYSAIDAVKVQIPLFWRQMRKALSEIGSNLGKLFKQPQEALSALTKAIFKITIAFNSGIKTSWERVKEAFFLGDGEKPSWWNLKEILAEIGSDLAKAWNDFVKQSKTWVAEGAQKLERQLTIKFVEEVKAMLQPIFQLIDFRSRIDQAFSTFKNVFAEIKGAWTDLKRAYEEGRSIIDRLFGPKADAKFPKKIREEGAGCPSGDYNFGNSMYPDPGVDLEVEPEVSLGSPFSGVLRGESGHQVTLLPDGSSFEDMEVRITNLQSSLKPGEKKKIYAGDPMGVTKAPARCVPHIHVSMNEKGRPVDPTRYLPRQGEVFARYVQVCNVYKLIFLNRVIAHNTFFGKKPPVDESPSRSGSPEADPGLPPVTETSGDRRRKRSVEKSKVVNVIKKFLKVPDDLNSGDVAGQFALSKMTMGHVVGLLDKLNLPQSKKRMVSLVHKFIELSKSRKCVRPEQLLDDELRSIVHERAGPVSGSREELIAAYYKKKSKCSFWSLALPERSSCDFDKDCLALECCLDYRLGFFYVALRAFARLDPDALTLHAGIEFYPYAWNLSLAIRDVEKEHMTGFKVELPFGRYELKVAYQLLRQGSALFFNLQIALCESRDACLPSVAILKDMLLPLPSRNKAGEIEFPKVDLDQIFNMREVLKAAKRAAAANVDKALGLIEKELGLPEGFLSLSSAPCSPPAHWTRPQLLADLGLSSSTLSTAVLVERAAEKARRCGRFSLPLPATSNIFCRIDTTCLNLTCCLGINVLDRNLSLMASASLDPCAFTLELRFHSARKTILLVDYRFGEEGAWRKGPLVMRYTVGRSTDGKFFLVSLRLQVCLSGASCVIDQEMLKEAKIPVPICNSQFAEMLSGQRLKELVSRGVRSTSELVKKKLSDLFGLNSLKNTTCASNQSCLGVLKPWSKRNCSAGSECWRFDCQLDLDLLVASKTFCVHFLFDPCQLEAEVGLGAWRHRLSLLRYVLGAQHQVKIGDAVSVFFKLEDRNQSFAIDLSYQLCWDGLCAPRQVVLKNVLVGKPFCHPNATKTLPGGSMSAFLTTIGVDLASSAAVSTSNLAVQHALKYLGISQCLTDNTCTMSNAGTLVDGWNNQCSNFSLPALPDMLQCSLDAGCKRLQCCLDADLRIWRSSLSFSVELLPCELLVRFKFEKCSADVPINGVEFGKEKTVQLQTKIRFIYRVDHDTTSNSLSLSAWLEFTLIKKWKPALLKDATLNCSRSAETLNRRRRFAAASAVGNLQFLPSLLASPMPRFVSYGQLVDTSDGRFRSIHGSDPDQPIFRSAAGHRSSSRRCMSAVPMQEAGFQWNAVVTYEGAELFDLRGASPRSILRVIGKGLTEAGKAALGARVAKLTIAEMIGALELRDLNPVVVVQFVKELRDTYFQVVSDLIDVIFNGGLSDIFRSMELILSGEYRLPRRHVKKTVFSYGFWVPPVPCIFRLKASIGYFWGVNFYGELRVMKMIAYGEVVPYAGLLAEGSASADCLIFKGVLRLTGYILETRLPIVDEFTFRRFPLKNRICVSIVIVPFRVELVAEVYIRLLFFVKRRKKRFFRAVWRAVVRIVRYIFRKVFKWKLIGRWELWSWGASPWRSQCFIGSDKPEPDPDPPVIVGGVCKVKQLPNRPPDFPVVELKADVYDPQSVTEASYAIGSAYGRTDLASGVKFNGPSALLDMFPYRGHTKLYFTITMTNSDKRRSSSRCHTTLDTTPPTGSVHVPYGLTSDPTRLSAELYIRDQTSITAVWVALGQGHGVWNDAVVAWRRVTVGPYGLSNAQGKGYYKRVEFSKLNMEHGGIFFVNAFITNSLGFAAILTSKPVIVDLTPPEAANSTGLRSQLLTASCPTYTLAKWQFACSARPPVQPNLLLHRDGAASAQLMWNGPHRRAPQRWTRFDAFMRACFLPFSDKESGIRGYSMCVGSRPCACDVVPPFDPHEGLRRPSDWNYCATALRAGRQNFAEGLYYWRLTALNRLNLAAALCHYSPYVIDTSPPVFDYVRRLRFDPESGRFSAHLAARDPQSGLRRVFFGLGISRHDVSLLPLKEVMSLEGVQVYDGRVQVMAGKTLSGKIYPQILLENNVELTAIYSPLRPLVVDYSPPIAGLVKAKHRFFSAAEKLCATWSGFHDTESGIATYDVALGSCSGCSNILVKRHLAGSVHDFCAPSSLSLTQGSKVFVTVIATHGGHAGLKANASSEEMTYDATPPLPFRVVDGALPGFVDQQFSRERALYSAQWSASSDPESRLKQTLVTLFRKSSTTASKLQERTVLPSAPRTVHFPGLNLRHKDDLFVEVTIMNGAGGTSSAQSNGQLVDLTPPEITVLRHAPSGTSDPGYQSNTDSLPMTFKVEDAESGIVSVQLALFIFKNRQRYLTGLEATKRFEANQLVSDTLSCGRLLQSGVTYGCRLAVGNQAGEKAVSYSPLVTVDTSPPHIEFVALEAGGDSLLHEGFLRYPDKNTLTLRARAFDAETGIKSFWVAIGSSKGAQDILPFRSVGKGPLLSVTGLSLQTANLATSRPAYYVTLKAQNLANLNSAEYHLDPLLVVPGDEAGIVLDGPGPVDLGAQTDVGLVTAKFVGFKSPGAGIAAFQAAVGTQPGFDDVQEFSDAGIVNEDVEKGSGSYHLPVPMEANKRYYTTIRAITNVGKVIEASSNGFINRITPLENFRQLYFDGASGAHSGVRFVPAVHTPPMPALSDENGPVAVERTEAAVPIAGIPAGSSQPGVPRYYNVRVTDSLGITTNAEQAAFVEDKTPPILKALECSPVVQLPERSVDCELKSVAEFESRLVFTEVALVRERSVEAPALASVRAQGPMERAKFRLTPVDFTSLGNSFFARAVVRNAAGLSTTRFSGAILRQPLPAGPTLVVNLGDVRRANWSDKSERRREASLKSPALCSNRQTCLSMNEKCQVSTSEITVAWLPFVSNTVKNAKYFVAIGSSAGGADICAWTPVAPSRTFVTLTCPKLKDHSKVFSSVKMTTEHSEVRGSSSAVFLTPGLRTHLKSLFKKTANGQLVTVTAQSLAVDLELPSNACPMSNMQWAIQRLDGTMVKEFSSTGGLLLTHLEYIGLNSNNGDTYFVLIKAKNELGLAQVYRSPGFVVLKPKLLSASVFDGPIPKHDLNSQASTSSLSANWDPFQPPDANLALDGAVNTLARPGVERYEVAIGSEAAVDDVMAFRDVGLKRKFTVHGLTLTPRAKYYVTVRASSRLYSSTQQTSDGITVGVNAKVEAQPITKVVWSPKTPKQVLAKWLAFQTAVGTKMKVYFTGMRLAGEKNRTCEEIMSIISDRPALDKFYNAAPFAEARSSTDDLLHTVSLTQANTYIVEVIGVNNADQCGLSRATFLADFTPPGPGSVTWKGLGSFKNIFFTRDRASLAGAITGFADKETALESLDVHLLHSSCAAAAAAADTWTSAMDVKGEPVIVSLQGNATSFSLKKLTLQDSVVYVLEVTAKNKLGLATTARSPLLLLETAELSAGEVKKATDPKVKENLFVNDEDPFTYSFFHGFASFEAGLKIPTTKAEWRFLKAPITSLTSEYPWVLTRDAESVSFKPSGVQLRLQRLYGLRGVSAGAISRRTAFSKDASVKFRARTAPGPLAITAFLLTEATASVTPVLPPSGATKQLRPVVRSQTDSKSTKASPQASWSVRSSDAPTAAAANACGMQLYQLAARHYMQLWCHNAATGRTVAEIKALASDPAVAAAGHSYELKAKPLMRTSWSIGAWMDGEELLVLSDGLPEFSANLQAVFHVFNNFDKLPKETDDISKLTSYSALIWDVELPNPHLMAAARPFLVSRPAAVHFEARLMEVEVDGAEPVQALTEWKEFLKPCTPCSTPCSVIFCNASCPRSTLHTAKWRWPGGGLRNSSSVALEARLRTVAGHEVVSTSQPAIVDRSGPTQAKELAFMYFDPERKKNDYKQISVQASRTAISFQCYIEDEESGIMERWWSLGTAVGREDVVAFERAPDDCVVKKEGLALRNKVKYYVSLAVINNAGISTLFRDEEGIRVLSDPPQVDSMKLKTPGSTRYDGNVRAGDAEKDSNGDKIAIGWSKPNDPAIQQTQYAVGTTDNKESDVVDWMTFERPETPSTKTEEGLLLTGGQVSVTGGKNKYNVRDAMKKEPKSSKTGIHLEPGKMLHHHVKMCTAASVCRELHPKKKVQIVPPGTAIVGGHAEIPASSVHRKRRSVGSDPVFRLDMSSSEPAGTSLLTGRVNDTSYYSDSSPTYASYIVSPEATITKTERMLRARVIRILSNGIYVATVGELELSAPLRISVRVPGLVLGAKEILRLIYWHTDSQQWRLAEHTCTGDTVTWTGADVTVQVCRTQEGALQAGAAGAAAFFKYPTHFVAAVLNSEIFNSAPIISPIPSLLLNGTELSQKAQIVLSATDPEGDPVRWELQPPLAARGSVQLDRVTGRLVYRSFPGQIGTDTVWVVARDQPTIAAIPSKSSVAELRVTLRTQENRPLLMVAHNGEVVDVTVERTRLRAAVTVTAAVNGSCPREADLLELLALDWDNAEGIKFRVQDDRFRVEAHNATPQLNHSGDYPPMGPAEYATRIGAAVHYPAENGSFSLLVVASDSRGLFSMPLHLLVTILTPLPCPYPSESAMQLQLLWLLALLLLAPIVIGVYVFLKRRAGITPISDDDPSTRSLADNPISMDVFMASSDRAGNLTSKAARHYKLGDSTSKAARRCSTHGFINIGFKGDEDLTAVAEA